MASGSSAVADARIKNQKVFAKYSKDFTSNDVDLYTQSAMKMAKWLSSERAYYREARPVVSLFYELAVDADGNKYSNG
jgi:hypothetical protein